MNQVPSPRLLALRSMIVFPALTSFVLFIFCVTNSTEPALNDPLTTTLLGYSSIMGVFGLMGFRNLLHFSRARFAYVSYRKAKNIALKDNVVLTFMVAVVFWHVGSALAVEAAADPEMINYNLASLAVVLNLVLGTFWTVVLCESVLMYYFTYGMRYRKFWFDYFYQANQLPPAEESEQTMVIQ